MKNAFKRNKMCDFKVPMFENGLFIAENQDIRVIFSNKSLQHWKTLKIKKEQHEFVANDHSK